MTAAHGKGLPNGIVWNSKLVADFGENGLYVCDGAEWTWLANWDIASLKIWKGELLVIFENNSICLFDGVSCCFPDNDKTSCYTMYIGNAENLHIWDNRLIADFGEKGLLLYENNSWTGLTGWIPEHIVNWKQGVAADFGDKGVYVYDGSSWTGLTGWNSENLRVWDDKLAADFGDKGLYVYDGNSWTGLTGWNPENLEPAF